MILPLELCPPSLGSLMVLGQPLWRPLAGSVPEPGAPWGAAHFSDMAKNQSHHTVKSPFQLGVIQGPSKDLTIGPLPFSFYFLNNAY